MRAVATLSFNYACTRISETVERITSRVKRESKNKTEIAGWRVQMRDYVLWFEGKQHLHGVPPPKDEGKCLSSDCVVKNSCMTWNRIHQQVKYLHDLRLTPNAFAGGTILDVGAGPHPAALCFEDCEIYGLDHLMRYYARMGFPMNEYGARYHFIDGKAERMPFESSFFDAVIAVNALDHVDDIRSAAREIRRVLKPNGKVRFIVEYHDPTVAEPLRLDDESILESFFWVKGLRKISESAIDWSFGSSLQQGEGGKAATMNERMAHKWFVVWSNF